MHMQLQQQARQLQSFLSPVVVPLPQSHFPAYNDDQLRAVMRRQEALRREQEALRQEEQQLEQLRLQIMQQRSQAAGQSEVGREGRCRCLLDLTWCFIMC